MATSKELKTSLPVVILSGSDEVVYGIMRSLKHYRIPIAFITWDKRLTFLLSRFVKEVIKAPNPINNENDCILFLCKHGEKMHQAYGTRILLFPSADNSLMLLANHYDELKRWFVMLGDPEERDLRRFTRKDLFFGKIENSGIPMPKTLSCGEEKDIEDVADSMVYPCITKPVEKDLAFSFFNRYRNKAVIARNKTELEKLLRENIETNTRILVQELVLGDTTCDYSWGGYRSKNGEFIQGIIGQKLRQISPGGTTNFAIKSDSKELEEYSQKILHHLNFWGICEIEYKRDLRDGLCKVIEMNPRCWMWFYLATGCGLNLPYIAYKEVYDGWLPETVQVKQQMKWVNLRVDFTDAVLGNKNGSFFKKLHHWLQSLQGEKVYAMFELSDPLVVLAYWANTLFRGMVGLAKKVIQS
jgi:predicted ATP-grasp superfamily ATP-dependent carboligase